MAAVASSPSVDWGRESSLRVSLGARNQPHRFPVEQSWNAAVWWTKAEVTIMRKWVRKKYIMWIWLRWCISTDQRQAFIEAALNFIDRLPDTCAAATCITVHTLHRNRQFRLLATHLCHWAARRLQQPKALQGAVMERGVLRALTSYRGIRVFQVCLVIFWPCVQLAVDAIRTGLPQKQGNTHFYLNSYVDGCKHSWCTAGPPYRWLQTPIDTLRSKQFRLLLLPLR
jgi:hypothetical protein